jgi:hypothetical protein
VRHPASIQNVLGRLLISQDFLPRSVTTGRFHGILRNKSFSRASVTTGPRAGGALSAAAATVLAASSVPQFALHQIQSRRTGSGLSMATCVFLCPQTGQRVQGWFADDGSENGGDTYAGVNCLACKQVHMVNPKTRKVLGADEETN